jgi:hypothetical protein
VWSSKFIEVFFGLLSLGLREIEEGGAQSVPYCTRKFYTCMGTTEPFSFLVLLGGAFFSISRKRRQLG